MADDIRTIGASTGDYATLALWEDDTDSLSTPNNLATSDVEYIGECLDEGEFTVAGTVVTISGQTTDATHRMILRCASGASFKDKGAVRTTALLYNASNGVAIRSTSNYASGISIGSNYVRLEGLQISGPSSGGSSLTGAGTNGVVDSCILRNPATNIQNINRTGGTQSFLNSLIYGGHSGMQCNGGGTIIVAGCTFIKLGSAGQTGAVINYASAYTVKNSAFFNYTTATSFNGSTNSGSGYNATDVASVAGSNNQVSLTFADQFESTTTDFRVKTGADLIGAGIEDLTNYPEDISGLTRADPPTIGAWEYDAGGGGGVSVPVLDRAMLAGGLATLCGGLK